MKEENRKYAREAMSIVEHAAYKIGSRLPGTDGEIKLHEYMGDKLREIGIEPKTEEFAVSPRSSIGGLSYAGWAGVIISIGAIIAVACGFNNLWYALAALSALSQLFGLCSVAFSTKHGLICSSRRKSAVTPSAFWSRRTASTITQSSFRVTQTHLGAGDTASMHISIRTQSLLWALLQPTVRLALVQFALF